MKQIAIMGYGTVGKGVDAVLEQNQSQLAARLGEAIGVKYILMHHAPEIPDARKVLDFARIEQDPEVSCVVETIGGCTAAKEYTERAFRAGKHVVTANKELVARHGRELLALARECGVGYCFEASVGGGIPILHPLTHCLVATEVTEICGILNGTTNYILNRMEKSGASFAAALHEAQELGYAEADPTADVEALDPARKLCILSDLAFGRRVLPEQVSTVGITRISDKDVAMVQRHGYAVRLLGRTRRMADGRISAFVEPHVVAQSSPLAGVVDAYNAILVRSNPLGDTFFYGRGAGAQPTACAVLSDVMELLCRSSVFLPRWDEDAEMASTEELLSRWYLRGERLPEGAQRLEKGEDGVAYLTQLLSRRQVQELAQRVHAVTCLRVFE